MTDFDLAVVFVDVGAFMTDFGAALVFMAFGTFMTDFGFGTCTKQKETTFEPIACGIKAVQHVSQVPLHVVICPKLTLIDLPTCTTLKRALQAGSE
jgi:hypothetical protein